MDRLTSAACNLSDSAQALQLPGNLLKMVDKYRIPTAIVGYSICSGTMLLLNKLAMHHIPVPSLVTVIQLVFAVVTIVVLQSMQMIPKDPLEWPKVKAYSIYMAAFVLGVYCNMRALENSNVETVIIFRSCTPLLVSLCDWLFLGRELPSRRSLAALLTIGLGAYGYVQADAQFKLEGASAYSWAALYFFAICFEMTYGKNITSGVRFNSMWGPTLYTNLLSVVPMFLLGYGLGDFDQFGSEDKVWSWSFPAITMLLASSIVGTLIGYTSWSCRSLVSATSFTLIGVINKFLTILLNVFIWDKHASPLGIAALVLCLLGGTAYKQSPMRVDKRDVSKEKEIESVALMVPVEDTEADTQK